VPLSNRKPGKTRDYRMVHLYCVDCFWHGRRKYRRKIQGVSQQAPCPKCGGRVRGRWDRGWS
jgi:hypothetical protein